MTRISVNKKVGIHVLLDRSLDLWISETAIKTGQTRTQIITQAIMDYLGRANPEGKKNIDGDKKAEEDNNQMEETIQEMRKEREKGIQEKKIE